VLLGGHVAEHRRAVPPDLRRADRAGDVVVPRRDVRRQRPEGVERRLLAPLELLVRRQVYLAARSRNSADFNSVLLCWGYEEMRRTTSATRAGPASTMMPESVLR
jgi:hypothetical protein